MGLRAASGAVTFECPLQYTQCCARTASNQQQCRRVTFRHPYCAHHLRQRLGLQVRPSRIHGCGLFSTRDIQAGDVVLPYTGERRAAFRGTPYVFGLAAPARTYVDATCLRGFGGYVNEARGTGRPTNVTARVATVHERDLVKDGDDDDDDDGPYMRPRTAALRKKFRRIPRALVTDGGGRRMMGLPMVWFVATRAIPANTEIVTAYHNAENRQMNHTTKPRACQQRRRRG